MQRLISKINKLQTYKMYEDSEELVELKDVIKVIEDYKLTLKEIRIEADRLGYIIVKRQYNKLIPCKCGCNKRRRVEKDGAYYIECKGCERYVVGKDVVEAVRKWNEVMTPPKKELSDEHKQHLSESAKAYWASRNKEKEDEPESW